jgi:hypothetical protein
LGNNKKWCAPGFNSGSIVIFTINDLTLGIKIDSKLLLYADDTSVLIFGTSIHEVQTKSIIALDNINKCFIRNGLPKT